MTEKQSPKGAGAGGAWHNNVKHEILDRSQRPAFFRTPRIEEGTPLGALRAFSSSQFRLGLPCCRPLSRRPRQNNAAFGRPDRADGQFSCAASPLDAHTGQWFLTKKKPFSEENGFPKEPSNYILNVTIVPSFWEVAISVVVPPMLSPE
jgi:hypothetical protein